MKRQLTLKKILAKTYGWLSGKKDPRVFLLSQLPKNSVGAEIGVWKGSLSQKALKIVRPKEFHLIDPWKFLPEFGGRWYSGAVAENQADMDKIYQSVSKKFAGRKVRGGNYRKRRVKSNNHA